MRATTSSSLSIFRFSRHHRIEHRLSQPRARAVSHRKSLHDRDRLSLAPAREQELGALKQVEDEEAQREHAEGDAADGEHEPAPALVDGPAAGADEPPRQQRADELADGPPGAEQGEERALRFGQELEEERAVDGEVAADAEAEEGEEQADGGPGGRVGDEQAEEGSEEEGCVKGDAAAEDVGANAPEEGAEAEAEVEPGGGVADLFFGDGELGGEGGED